MLHTIIDILRNSILITGLVVIMMMMIESLNIESKGMIFSGLRKTKIGQVVISAMLGLIPGCIGGFASVSLYTHGIISFGALIAMMIASSGDEAFMIIAMIPDQAMQIFLLLFVIAVVCGLLTDFILAKALKHNPDMSHAGLESGHNDLFELHEHEHDHGEKKAVHNTGRHLGWERVILFLGVAVFIAALCTGQLGHDHGHDNGNIMRLNLLSENWMYVLFALLSVIVLIVLCFASDHFVEKHLWDHIVKKHLPTIFTWTAGVLALIGIGLQYVDISGWISDNTALMILLAVAVGIIPESGPHMIFVTLYATGIVPFPVLLASSISQDGHSSLPLLAESKISFINAKLINCAAALAFGFGSMLFF